MSSTGIPLSFSDIELMFEMTPNIHVLAQWNRSWIGDEYLCLAHHCGRQLISIVNVVNIGCYWFDCISRLGILDYLQLYIYQVSVFVV